MKKINLTIALILSSISFTMLFAQSANLSVQGVLRTAEGTAVENGDYEITCKIYTQATLGNPIWEEIIPDVKVKGGIYSIVLGSGSTPLDVAFDQPYFIGVSVNGGIEMIPRARLTSSPYALSLIGSDNIFPNSGNVGIGNPNPTRALSIKKDDARFELEILDGSHHSMISARDNGMLFRQYANKAFIFWDNGGERMRISNQGRLGLGTSSPTDLAHFKGDGANILKLEGNDEIFKLVGSSAAYIGLYRNGTSNGRTAYIGFTDPNYSTMNIHNNVGTTSLRGKDIILKTTNYAGSIFCEGNGELNRLIGTSYVFTGFYPNGMSAGRKGYIGYVNTGNDFHVFNENGDGDLILKAGGEVRLDNTTLKVTGSKNININDFWIYDHNGTHSRENQQESRSISIYADRGVRAHSFNGDSDRRFKKDFRISKGTEDLATLKEIEVTDYRHIDELEYGNAYKKGLIAQQVESIFSEAITETTSIIPNIFDYPVSIEVKNNQATFEVSKPHDLAVGDKLKIVTKNGSEFFNITEVTNPKSFTIQDWKGTSKAKEAFVYGKEIHDFKTVDYDRVFTLAVSATQELARKMEALEKQNAQLLKERNDTKAELNTLSTRVKAMEDLFNTTAKSE